ncbi:hypothetical protein DOK76_05450 [Vagococcus sp. DIV0080]|uniref:Lipoprotein n=1 Tax=Candidatus Vagococcus giribetii TaxID=2230876 RepID=A0ABS3HRW0_9ENTE|nr:hypothetical protein [Vagococcus sp. DIV0080]MBO0476506.1 hypothetical protein [Vagococcus sp. DIV0080]
MRYFSRKSSIILFLLLSLSLLLVACSSPKKNQPKKAHIIQILNNQNSLQQNAVYYFDNGTLTVSLTYAPFRKPNELPNEFEDSDIVKNDMKRYEKEFPNTSLNLDNFSPYFEKTIKKVTLNIDEDKKEVSLTGKDFNKSFKQSETNNNRLIDDVGIEYELKIDH